MVIATGAGMLGVALFMFALVAFPPSAQAFHQPEELHGYGWSSTIGWIGFNCADTAVCSAFPNLKVIKTGDTLSGFAWSSFIGWITFTPVSPYPEAPLQSARFSGDTITGWARACNVFASGCSGTLRPDSERGGWDGWIKLSGVAQNGGSYGVQLGADGKFTGFSWGADVVQWIDWSKVTLTREPAPLAPTAVAPSCSAGIGKIQVSWTAVSGATKYRVYRGATANFTPATALGEVTTTSFTDTSGLAPGTTYYYRISAGDGVSWSEFSPASSGTTPSEACPDLIVEPLSIEVISTDATPLVYDATKVPSNTPIRFRAKIKNIGGGTGVTFKNQFTLDGTTIKPLLGIPINGLGASLSTTITMSILDAWTSTVGPHTIQVCADRPPDNGKGLVIDESSETNNCLTLPFTVIPPTPLTATLEARRSGSSDIFKQDYIIIPYGQKPELRWTTGGTPSTCTGKVDWSGNKAPAGGTEILTLPTLGQKGNPFEYSFKVECVRP